MIKFNSIKVENILYMKKVKLTIKNILLDKLSHVVSSKQQLFVPKLQLDAHFDSKTYIFILSVLKMLQKGGKKRIGRGTIFLSIQYYLIYVQ